MKLNALLLLIFAVFAIQAQNKIISNTLLDSNQSNVLAPANLSAAMAVGANYLWPGGALGFNATGNGLNIGVWEAPLSGNTEINAALPDLNSRVTTIDANGVSSHATNVGKLLASNGSPFGLAYQAQLYSFSEAGKFAEMDLYAYSFGQATGILVSNHSYSGTAGWYSGFPSWYGVKEISEVEDYKFGRYGGNINEDLNDNKYDETAYNHPFLTIVKASGNDLGATGSTPYSRYAYASGTWPIETGLTTPVPEADGGSNGFDCIPASAMGKNILTVGACDAFPVFPPNGSDLVLDSQSGWGPADDGRIKPDLVAPGDKTSYSTPVVTGGILLLQDAYYSIYNNYMTSATARALVCHTAIDGGNPGPDYKFGWGMLNLADAGQVIKESPDKNTKNHIVESTLNNNDTVSYYFYIDANTTEAKLTLSWTDVEGTPTTLVFDTTDLNNRTPMLVNDLDLRLIKNSDSTFYLPYILDPNNPDNLATFNDNVVDNIESINHTLNRGWYTVKIYHKGNLHNNAAQDFSLISSGLTVPVVYNLGWGAVGPPNSSDVVAIVSDLEIAAANSVFSKHLFVADQKIISLQSNTAKLHISGDISTGNNVKIQGNGDVEISGDNASFCGDLEIENLLFEKTAGQNFEILSGSSLAINGLLKLNSGSIIAQSNLTLLANANGYAQIMQTGGNILGNINAQTFIQGNSGFRYLASPVNTTLQDLINDFDFYNLNNNGNVCVWNAAISSWQYNQLLTNPFYKNAFAVFFGTSNFNGKLFTPLPFTVNLNGPINQGNLTLNTDYSIPSDASNFTDPAHADGWNLLTNPYPSGLDWNEVKAANVDNYNGSYYIFDPNTNQYLAHNGISGNTELNGTIAPFQAYFIKYNSAPTQAFTLTNAMRTAQATTRLKTEPTQIQLVLKQEGKKRDETNVTFLTQASLSFDNALDAHKITNASTHQSRIFSYTENDFSTSKLAVNCVGYPQKFHKINLGVTGTENTEYQISTSSINVPQHWNVFILDRYKNKVSNLRESAYDFTYQEKSAAQRFQLFIGPEIEQNHAAFNSNLFVLLNNNVLEINNLNKEASTQVMVYSLSGKLLLEHNTKNASHLNLRINENLTNTLAIIYIQNGDLQKVIKLPLLTS